MRGSLALLSLFIALLAIGCAVQRQGTTMSMSAPVIEPAAVPSGDPVQGRRWFVAVGCHTCHRVAEDLSLPKVAGDAKGPLLRDCGLEDAESLTARIVTTAAFSPEAIYDEPMTETVSRLSDRQLADIVSYLRNPRAGRRTGT